MTIAITENIGVEVESFFTEMHSNPMQDYFVFSYRITITNNSKFTVQLLSRSWEIFDAILERRLVEGDGVIGEQPILYPGTSYQYMSYCQFKSDAGSMKGHYTFNRVKDNNKFKVMIPEFILMPEYRKN